MRGNEMSKRNSELALIATWTTSEDPTTDLPSVVRYEDGTPTTEDEYLEHLNDTHRWDFGPEGVQRISWPSIVATVRYDPIASVWAVSGHGVTPSALDITDPEVPDDEIIAELYTFPMVYRAKVHRPGKKGATYAITGKRRGPNRSANLFWIASLERRSDWLIFATSLRSAAAFHRE
jgi:hypothetical protein